MSLITQNGGVSQVVDAQDGSGNAVKALMHSIAIGGATYQLLQGADGSADGDPVANIVGGEYLFGVAGTFGGGTVALAYLGPDGATYIDLPDTELTAVGALVVRIGSGATVKATITGATDADLYANLT